jgi:hypothetical protein
MFHRVKNAFRKRWFAFRSKGILATPPIQAVENGVKVVTMVSHQDVIMCLIAVKSFYACVKGGEVIVINDGSLTSGDLDLLKVHLSAPQVISVRDIGSGRCPTGGCWERLLLIAELVKQSHVVQLDSDTITLRDIPEVREAIASGSSFTLGTGMGRNIVPMNQICDEMKAYSSDHVQVLAEQLFDRLHRYPQLRYIRGSAGFAGFAKGSFSRGVLEDFSAEMQSSLGKRWSAWGSEQVASNVMVANAPKASVLPYPKYSNFTPEIRYEECSFLHFIGTHRFEKGVYLRSARDIGVKLAAAR